MTVSLPAWLRIWKSPAAGRDTISALYGMIVAQARQPVFYAAWGVPDTVNGRVEMIMLHLCLVLDRLAAAPGQAAASQRLFDRFCLDIDDNLREIGIGDLTVPKQMRRVGEAFYGRATAYRAARTTDAPNDALAEVLARNALDAPQAGAAAAGAQALAAYVRTVDQRLAATPAEDILAGRFEFPPAEAR